MDIIDLIKEDHERVNELFERVEATTGENRGERETLFAALRTALESHTNAEERVLYQRLEEVDSLNEEMAESYEDHEEVATLLQALSELESNNETWKEKFQTLKEAVLSHVAKEEDIVLVQAQKLISDDERDEMGDDMQSLEDEIVSAGPGLVTQTPARSMIGTIA